MLDDYWYDSALFVCEDILKGFSDDEWEKLLEAIPNESVEWKKRLVECLGGLESPYELECIIRILDNANDDLLVACIDSLRSIDISTLQGGVKKNIAEQVKSLNKRNNSLPVKRVLEDFLALIV